MYFVDDSQIVKELSRSNLTQDLATLETQANLIADHIRNIDLELNTDKTELIVHCNRSDLHLVNNLKINVSGQIIINSSTIRSLGLHKDTLMTWSFHISNTIKSCNKSLWMIRCLHKLMEPDQLKIIIESYCFSKLYYMDVVWCDTTKMELQRANKVFKSAVKLLLGCHYSKEEFDRLCWLDIFEHSLYSKLCLAYKIRINQCPAPFTNFFKENAITLHTTRSGHRSSIDKSICNDHLSYSITEAWSRLPEDVVSSESLPIFKTAVKNWIINMRPPKQTGCDLSCIEQAIYNNTNNDN